MGAAAEAKSTCDARERGPHSRGCRGLHHAWVAWGHQGSLPLDIQMAHTALPCSPWRAARGRQEVWSHLSSPSPKGCCTPEPGSSPRPRHHRHASPLLTLLALSSLRGRLSIQDHLHLPALEFSETLSHYRITYSTEFSEMYPVYSVWVSKLFLSTLLF